MTKALLVATILFSVRAAYSVPTKSAPSRHAEVAADFERVCNAPERSGATKLATPIEKAAVIASYIDANIKTDEVRHLFGRLASMSAEEKGTTLKKAAKDAGYAGPCPVADFGADKADLPPNVVDYGTLCNAYAASHADAIHDRAKAHAALDDYLRAHLKTAGVYALFQELAPLKPADKAQKLVHSARDTGFDRACPLAVAMAERQIE